MQKKTHRCAGGGFTVSPEHESVFRRLDLYRLRKPEEVVSVIRIFLSFWRPEASSQHFTA